MAKYLKSYSKTVFFIDSYLKIHSESRHAVAELEGVELPRRQHWQRIRVGIPQVVRPRDPEDSLVGVSVERPVGDDGESRVDVIVGRHEERLVEVLDSSLIRFRDVAVPLQRSRRGGGGGGRRERHVEGGRVKPTTRSLIDGPEGGEEEKEEKGLAWYI